MEKPVRPVFHPALEFILYFFWFDSMAEEIPQSRGKGQRKEKPFSNHGKAAESKKIRRFHH
jgi:hypothetical protein